MVRELFEMTVIHKEDNGIIRSSGKGDWGICNKCNKRVDHLLVGKNREPVFSPDVRVTFEDLTIKGLDCPDCGGPVSIRNPMGKCDHLHYPDYKKKRRI